MLLLVPFRFELELALERQDTRNELIGYPNSGSHHDSIFLEGNPVIVTFNSTLGNLLKTTETMVSYVDGMQQVSMYVMHHSSMKTRTMSGNFTSLSLKNFR